MAGEAGRFVDLLICWLRRPTRWSAHRPPTSRRALVGAAPSAPR